MGSVYTAKLALARGVGGGVGLLRIFVSLCEIKWMHRLQAGNFGAASPLHTPPSAVPAATSASQVDREDLGYFAFSNIGFK